MYSEPSLSVHIFVHNSYLTVIGVHEMHRILLVVDLCSSLAYFMIAGKFHIKTLVARQLPTNVHVYIMFNAYIISYRMDLESSSVYSIVSKS